MHLRNLKPAGLLLAAVAVLAAPLSAVANDGRPAEVSPLSTYWSPAVTRWEPILLHFAELWSLDPNFVAAVVWKESLGRAGSHSPAGAVGLMGVMPFPWRPSAEELENPWTNVHWGSRALAQTIGDGKGDLYYSLAAYNGSWEKAGQNNTRRYAAAVLDLYARSVAVLNGLSPDGEWVALIGVEGMPGPVTLTVFGPQRELTRHTSRPLEAATPTIPNDVPPHATVIEFANGRDDVCRVNMWLLSADGDPLPATAKAEPEPSPADRAGELGIDSLDQAPRPR
jgi:hypothetical protein